MNIHFTEHEDLIRKQTIIVAYTIVGGRKIESRMYLSFNNCPQNYIDAAYHRLKDEVRGRALTEMRSQQYYNNSMGGNLIDVALAAGRRAAIRYQSRLAKPRDKVDWKKEGF